mmetsp:Transcript_13045/g.20260  ORF Transcript_13045/g.20260 Transcript_13045/m.20260 type:complete len:160 (-) Transcript_13045:130-609(-)
MRSEEYIDKFSSLKLDNLLKKFEKKGREARLKGEEAAKLKAMRTYTFGKHIASIPAMGTTRWYDYPLSESSAAHVSLEEDHLNVEPTTFVASQHLEGKMIPRGEMAEIEEYVGKDSELIDSFAVHKTRTKANAEIGVVKKKMTSLPRSVVGVFKKKKAL